MKRKSKRRKLKSAKSDKSVISLTPKSKESAVSDPNATTGHSQIYRKIKQTSPIGRVFHRRGIHETLKPGRHVSFLPAQDGSKDDQSKLVHGGFSVPFIAYSSLTVSLFLFVIVGVLLYFQAMSITLLSADYTHCKSVETNESCSKLIDSQMAFNKTVNRPCHCRLGFDLNSSLRANQINIYYGLTNYNQNYRFLAQSKDTSQLRGHLNAKTVSTSCRPSRNPSNITVVPCGALANVLFDDEFTLKHETGIVEFDRYNIPLDGVRGNQHRNPEDLNRILLFGKPPRWRTDLTGLDDRDPKNNAFENGPLIVWMTVSTFSYFTKLYAIINLPRGLLPSGNYTLDILYRYGVGGPRDSGKIAVIQTVGLLGVNNAKLLVVTICLATIYLFLFIFIALVVWRRWAYHVQAPSRVL